MNKDELLKEVAKKAGVPQKTAYDVVNSILDIVEKTVSKGKKVTLIGFGTFEARKRGARIGRNPQTGKELILHPVEVLPGVKPTLEKLAGKYHLSVVTKGDLLDQERKLQDSGLLPLFNHVEIVSDKTPTAYRALFVRLGAKPQEVLMVGNSLKSDIFPALEAGAQAAYLPCACNWKHEESEEPENPPYLKITALPDLLPVLL